MKGMGDRALMVGALLVGLIVAAIVWFLMISPKLSSAQSAKEAAEAQRNQNDILQATLLQRQNSAENMPDYIREVHSIRDLLPPTESVPEVRRLIDEITKGEGLVVEIDRLSPAVPVIGGISIAAPMEEVGLISEIEGLTFSTLLGTTYSLELEGPTDKVLNVIEEIRSGNHRFILVTSLTFATDKAENTGDVRATINAIFFTLDNGNPDIHVRPEERPWPGTEEEEAAQTGGNIFEPIVDPAVV